MRLDRYISKSRIIEIEHRDLKSALEDLVAVSLRGLREDLNQEKLVKALLEREHSMTTYLGNGVAMPHIRVKMRRPYIFAVGRVKEGIEFEGMGEYNDVRLIFLLLASDNGKNYLNVLASLARLFRERDLVQRIVEAHGVVELRKRVVLGFGGLLAKPERKPNRFNKLLLREAEKIAREAKCSAILIFADTFAGGIDVLDSFPKFRTIMVARVASDRPPPPGSFVEGCIEVRSFSRQRLSQARSAVLIGLTRGMFKYNDRLCCIGGIPASNQFDSLVVIDIEREFHSLIDRDNDLLPPSVKIEVVERLLAVATEIAVEGREGKPVGTLFVLGDTPKVNSMVKPLVMNPFYGYKEEDRNILNPFMDETIKEFSVIDGCFVIRGDGVIESAGSLIHAPSEYYENLPGGYGARHSAAAAITLAADCIAICVSESSGQVTLFRKGVMLPLLEKPIRSQL
ncbi:MAG: PTS sugar transporter subunit IIA [Verrucomicrobia bacterium]|nr:PTS sugar transporter subunit IIA [Verrucomicrobiota bacterium]